MEAIAMNKSPKAEYMKEFPPVEYYECWADQFEISVTRYPYILMDFDPSVGKQMPFAVWNFYMNTVDGWPVASATIVYKAVHGKTTFRRLIYLTGNHQTPTPLLVKSTHIWDTD